MVVHGTSLPSGPLRRLRFRVQFLYRVYRLEIHRTSFGLSWVPCDYEAAFEAAEERRSQDDDVGSMQLRAGDFWENRRVVSLAQRPNGQRRGGAFYFDSQLYSGCRGGDIHSLTCPAFGRGDHWHLRQPAGKGT